MIDLKEYIDTEIENSLILESSEFYDSFTNQMQNLIENWCLIRYCTLGEQSDDDDFNPEVLQNKIHWIVELQATMLNIKRIPKSLKNKYSTVLDKVLENNDIVDKSSWKTILSRLEDKCEKEKINIPEPTNQSSDHYENDPIIIRSAKDFIKYGIKDVIYTIMDNFKSKPGDKKSNYEKYTNTI